MLDNITYDYTTDIDSKTKYGFGRNKNVKAIYTNISEDHNPLLDALPTTVDTNNIKDMYYKNISIECNTNNPQDMQISEIQRLRNLRLPLPFMAKMEMQFNLSLQIACKHRAEYLIATPIEIIMRNAARDQNLLSRSVMGGDIGIGLSLLGVGGCGKTEAITTMLARYPQVIEHDIEGVGNFVQIIYITVITPSNANLNDLYTAIAEAIDEALGNINPVYSRYIRNKQTVGSKARYIAQLVRIFNICSIILDEVQNLDNRRNKEDSYNSLMEIINTTKVSIVLVGTEEAYTMLCKKQYLARRTGDIIDASKYCYDYERFCIRMAELMKFNWFKKDVVLDPEHELFKALYEETRGTIYRMVSLWIDIQIAYVTAKIKPAITADFIRLISANSNPLLSHFTAEALENSPFSLISMEATKRGETNIPVLTQTEASEMAKTIRRQKADSILFAKLSDTGNPEKARRVFEKVKETEIYLGKAFRDDTIIDCISRIMRRKDGKEADDIKLVQRTLASLENRKTDARPEEKNRFIAPKENKSKEIKEEFTKDYI